MRYLLLMILATVLVFGGCGGDSDDNGRDMPPALEKPQAPTVPVEPDVEESAREPVKTPDQSKKKVNPKDTFAQEPGFLSVQTKPWSRVYVDGRFIKNSPLVHYKLKPGTHDVMVENPQFKIKRSFKVKIVSGQNTTLVKKLI